jgi:hypothetical protein
MAISAEYDVPYHTCHRSITSSLGVAGDNTRNGAPGGTRTPDPLLGRVTAVAPQSSVEGRAFSAGSTVSVCYRQPMARMARERQWTGGRSDGCTDGEEINQQATLVDPIVAKSSLRFT